MHRRWASCWWDGNGIAGTDKFVRFVATRLSPSTYVNIMAQYRPAGRRWNPMVQAKNPAPLDQAVPLPSFNDEFAGAGPDIGAFENGPPPLRFGREMAPGFTRAPVGVVRGGMCAALLSLTRNAVQKLDHAQLGVGFGYYRDISGQ
jgi:hypothetical protein